MDPNTKPWQIIAWFLGILFLIIGIMNLIFIHPVPAVFYISVSSLYLPFTAKWVKQICGFAIPPVILIILAFLNLWLTLGVGDLMEYFESKLL